MALVQATLASGLAGMAPTPTEAAAISQLATIWESYFTGASITGIPVLPTTVAAGKTAFSGALVGMSAPNAAAAKLQAAVTAFWAAVVGLGPAAWLLAPNTLVVVVPPPTITGIAAALQAVFSASTSANKTLPQAAADIAAVLHTNGGIGGTCTIQPPPPAPPFPSVIL